MARLALFTIVLLVFGVGMSFGQAPAAKKTDAAKPADPITSSPAYAEILLRRTELSAELESLLVDYTDEYPKVKEIRYQLEALKQEYDRIMKVRPADAGKLTLALGKLIVKKVDLETDVWNLLKTYKDEHPDVKRAKRKVEIYEAAIREILN